MFTIVNGSTERNNDQRILSDKTRRIIDVYTYFPSNNQGPNAPWPLPLPTCTSTVLTDWAKNYWQREKWRMLLVLSSIASENYWRVNLLTWLVSTEAGRTVGVSWRFSFSFQFCQVCICTLFGDIQISEIAEGSPQAMVVYWNELGSWLYRIHIYIYIYIYIV